MTMKQPVNVLEYEILAREKLTKMALDYYSSGAWDEVTLDDNQSAFLAYRFRPRVLIDVSVRDTGVTVLGEKIAMPILIAPTAFHGLAHPEGELPAARAAAKCGTIFVLSTISNKSIEEVAGASGSAARWFQLYVHRDRGLTRDLVERAEASGYKALCVTVDTPLLGRRERDMKNQFALPAGLTMGNLAHIKLDKMQGESSLYVYIAEQFDPSINWKDIEWLRSITRLPVVLKGILRGDDARIAVKSGASAIVVSNHGGRQLDGAIATIDALEEVVGATDGAVEVLMDGGIRRGTDVLKALALGARAVLIGRPVLWGLAVAGEDGVSHVLRLLHAELDLAMALGGIPEIRKIDRSLIIKR